MSKAVGCPIAPLLYDLLYKFYWDKPHRCVKTPLVLFCLIQGGLHRWLLVRGTEMNLRRFLAHNQGTGLKSVLLHIYLFPLWALSKLPGKYSLSYFIGYSTVMHWHMPYHVTCYIKSQWPLNFTLLCKLKGLCFLRSFFLPLVSFCVLTSCLVDNVTFN